MNDLKTKVVKVDPDNIDLNVLQEAAEIINNGGLVVFPTETVYGLGADALNEDACAKVFEAKGRPQDNPLIVHIIDINDLNTIVEEIPSNARILAKNFWPGPLTMLFKRKPIIKDIVTAGLDTVGIRMPKNKIALELIRLSKTPIAAPSANTSGKPSPTEASHVIEDLYGKVDMIIDGGSTSIGLESSVVDVTVDIPMILRPGGVTSEDIKSVLGSCDYDPAIIKNDEKIIPRSPGQKYRHYSPKAKVITYKGSINKMVEQIQKDCKLYLDNGSKVGIMATDQTKNNYQQGIVSSIGDRNNPITIASNLFRQLRNFDKLGVDVILSESFEEQNIGKAIMNRLGKASSEIKTLPNFNLLLICTGNTCRSCIAEGIIKNVLYNKNLPIDVCSAGISAIDGESASKYAVEALKEINIDISNYKSKVINDKMLEKANLILTMTEKHKHILLRTNKEISDKIYTFKEYVNSDVSLDILDPYGQDLDVYRKCRDEIKESVNNVISKIHL
ncbi:threonylcarbamoyl-AMP synthase [Sedimentibacter sp. zth1]|uniref:L-threonylcarbamoyladenylate synthase n=1 Tax=Sedimentibacter sp. zth1 TaxID=2816908 RepID=UPI001A9168D1|nr:L-threonylcarbamoyladenylate synthase [Sedimentibacter sp. zth1]QSX05053.1 threonylcarbamoyl-AMP synthase [Sedimentibacter sp. zth1]